MLSHQLEKDRIDGDKTIIQVCYVLYLYFVVPFLEFAIRRSISLSKRKLIWLGIISLEVNTTQARVR